MLYLYISYVLDIKSDGIAHVRKEDVLRLSKHCVKLGDIIYSRRGDIEKCAFISQNEEGWLCGTGCLRIRINPEKANPHFIAYQLSTKESKSWIVGNAVGTTMLNLNTGILKELPLFIPNKQTQDSVVFVLKSLDDKIEVNKRINDNLEQQAQALFKSWFVDFEPFKNQPFIESELGMIPKGWRVVKLGAIIEEMPKSTIQVNHARTAQGQYPFFTSGSSVYQYDSLIVSGRNIFLNTGGVAGVRFYIGGAAYSTDTWCIKGIDDYSDFLYLYLADIVDLLNSQYFEGSALKHLKKKALKERLIIIPPSVIINNFNMIVKPMHDKIYINYNLKNYLSSIRDTLLPRLMSGNLEVKDIEQRL